jgi:hypothetical protein
MQPALVKRVSQELDPSAQAELPHDKPSVGKFRYLAYRG